MGKAEEEMEEPRVWKRIPKRCEFFPPFFRWDVSRAIVDQFAPEQGDIEPMTAEDSREVVLVYLRKR